MKKSSIPASVRRKSFSSLLKSATFKSFYEIDVGFKFYPFDVDVNVIGKKELCKQGQTAASTGCIPLTEEQGADVPKAPNVNEEEIPDNWKKDPEQYRKIRAEVRLGEEKKKANELESIRLCPDKDKKYPPHQVEEFASGRIQEIDSYPEDWGKGPGEYTAYRAGSLNTQRAAIFFAPDFSGAKPYSSENSGPVVEYKIKVKNPKVSDNLYTLYSELSGKTISQIYEERNRSKDVNKWWQNLDKKLVGMLKKAGHDAVVYTKPAPPASREMAVWSAKEVDQVVKTQKSHSNYFTKSLTSHKYGCLLAILPQDIRKKISDWATENIPQYDQAPDGIDFQSHITIAFGFDNSETDLPQLKSLLTNHGPIQFRIGGTAAFPMGKDGVPLILEVEEDQQLQALHAEIRSVCEKKQEVWTKDLDGYWEKAGGGSIEGQPCQQGQSAEKTGCIPASGETTSSPKKKITEDDVFDLEATLKKITPEKDKAALQQELDKIYDESYRNTGNESEALAMIAATFQELINLVGGSPPPPKETQLEEEKPTLGQQSKKWLQDLSQEERDAIDYYVSAKGFEKMNSALRGGKKDQEVQTAIDNLSEAIKKFPKPKEPITTYRGMSLDYNANNKFISMAEESLKEGKEIQFKGFTSSSPNREIANEFAEGEEGNKRIILQLSSRNGAYKVSQGHSEWIQPHGVSYKVGKVQKNVKIKDPETGQEKVYTIIEMNEV